MFGVIGIVALLLVLRPMVRRLTNAPVLASLHGGADMTALAGPQAVGGVAQLAGVAANPALAGPNAGVPALSGPAGARMAAIEDESMVNIANVEGQLRASSIRRLSDLVEKHPEESLTIMRAWMQQETA